MKDNKKIIVNYCKRWNPETGTCYTQTIKIDNTTKMMFNHYLTNAKKQAEKNFIKNKHCYSENDLKIKSLNYLSSGVNYTNLIHLQLFIEFYLKALYTPPKKDRDYERILWRNTILEVI